MVYQNYKLKLVWIRKNLSLSINFTDILNHDLEAVMLSNPKEFVHIVLIVHLMPLRQIRLSFSAYIRCFLVIFIGLSAKFKYTLKSEVGVTMFGIT